MILPLLLLLAAAPRVELVDEIFEIPPEEWRYVEVSLKQQPVSVGCEYEVESSGGSVRVALLTRADMLRMRDGRAYGVVASTEFGPAGSMHLPVHLPGQYALVVDNRSPGPRSAKVHLRVYLDFSHERGQIGTLSRGRQLAVILISFSVFFGIVFWSGRRLLRAIRG
ncbi:MAG TPA: hypothetical protein VG672_00225 [Bryobacteraceae bacterium]|jgi:hypothetical protein|nr:hypothetical protein [Bryobacteraceae bacterium]